MKEDMNNAAYYVGYYYYGVNDGIISEDPVYYGGDRIGMAVFITFREGIRDFTREDEKDRGKEITEEQIKTLHESADIVMNTLGKERGHAMFDIY